jgi:golgin subfamily B member 1
MPDADKPSSDSGEVDLQAQINQMGRVVTGEELKTRKNVQVIKKGELVALIEKLIAKYGLGDKGALIARISELEMTMQQAQARAEEATSRAGEMAGRLRAMEERVKGMESRAAAVASDCDRAQARADAAEKRLAQATENATAAEADLRAKAESMRFERDSAAAQYEARLTEAAASRKAVQERVAELDRDLAAARQGGQHKQEDLQRQMEALQKELAGRTAALEAEVAALAAARDCAVEESAVLRKELAERAKAAEALTRENAALKDERQALQASVVRLETDLARTAEERDTARSRAAEETAALRKALAERTEAAEALAKENSILKNERQALQTANAHLESELRRTVEERDAARARAAQAEKDLAGVKAGLDGLQKAFDDAEAGRVRQIEELRAKSHEMETQLGQARAVIEANKEEMARLRLDLDSERGGRAIENAEWEVKLTAADAKHKDREGDLRRMIDEADQRAAEAESRIARAEANARSWEDEIKQSRREIARLEAEIKAMQDGARSLASAGDAGRLKAARDQAGEEMSRMKIEQQERIEAIRSQMDAKLHQALRDKESESQEQLTAANDQVASQKRQIADLKARIWAYENKP